MMLQLFITKKFKNDKNNKNDKNADLSYTHTNTHTLSCIIYIICI